MSKAALLRSSKSGGGGGGGGGGGRGNEPPLQVNDGGLKTQAVNFHPKANSGGMENKL